MNGDKTSYFRALEVLHHKGRKLSEIIDEQQKSEGGSILGGGLRYLNAIVLWLQCEQVSNRTLFLRLVAMKCFRAFWMNDWTKE